MMQDSYFSISSVVQMEMSSPSVATRTSSCVRQCLDPMVPCGDGTKVEECGESYDLLSPERELEPRLDGLDESARFTPLNNFFILHNTYNNNTQ
jgi:hypothetical protein